MKDTEVMEKFCLPSNLDRYEKVAGIDKRNSPPPGAATPSEPAKILANEATGDCSAD